MDNLTKQLKLGLGLGVGLGLGFKVRVRCIPMAPSKLHSSHNNFNNTKNYNYAFRSAIWQKSSKIDTRRSAITDLQQPFILICPDCGTWHNVSRVSAMFWHRQTHMKLYVNLQFYMLCNVAKFRILLHKAYVKFKDVRYSRRKILIICGCAEL